MRSVIISTVLFLCYINELKRGIIMKKNIAFVSVVILAGLFVLDVIFKGQVFKRLPRRWQDSLSAFVERDSSK